jgi:hypothetical protein
MEMGEDEGDGEEKAVGVGFTVAGSIERAAAEADSAIVQWRREREGRTSAAMRAAWAEQHNTHHTRTNQLKMNPTFPPSHWEEDTGG